MEIKELYCSIKRRNNYYDDIIEVRKTENFTEANISFDDFVYLPVNPKDYEFSCEVEFSNGTTKELWSIPIDDVNYEQFELFKKYLLSGISEMADINDILLEMVDNQLGSYMDMAYDYLESYDIPASDIDRIIDITNETAGAYDTLMERNSLIEQYLDEAELNHIMQNLEMCALDSDNMIELIKCIENVYNNKISLDVYEIAENVSFEEDMRPICRALELAPDRFIDEIGEDMYANLKRACRNVY